MEAKFWFGQMDASDARKLRALEEENHWLKKLLAEEMFDVYRVGRSDRKPGRSPRAAVIAERIRSLLAARA